MYLTIRQQLKHLSKEEYYTIKELCYIAKNLTNEAIYNVRQYYFNEKKYLQYVENYFLLKNSPNYKMLNASMAQQLLREVDDSFKSFFALIKLVKNQQYSFERCQLPNYLSKNGYTTLIISKPNIKNNKLILPYSYLFRQNHKKIEIKVPPIITDKEIKEVRIIPRMEARFFEIQYIYKVRSIQRNLNNNNALAIDFGINNLITAVSSQGGTFIIDGRKLKSINQWFNKEISYLQKIKNKQHLNQKYSHKQANIANNRQNRVDDYISKSARIVINYCLNNDIGILIVGYNKDFQHGIKMGKKSNQNFMYIPYSKLRDKIKYLCQLNNIIFIEQEESYTSKASFWDKDIIPAYKDNVKTHIFSGKRISRGLYKTASGKTLNADVNGALNIMRKSNVVDLDILYSRGDVDAPIRIRIT